MANIYKNLTELIGNTPLMELTNLEKAYDLNAKLYAKLEYFNPAGSIKDRVADKMIRDYESKGLLKKGSVIIEPTSGNTGIGLAAVAAAKGYECICVMPESMSIERRTILKAYGAKVELTDASKGMQGSIDRAKELNESIEGSIIAGQFVNPSNPEAHMESTGKEIYADLDGAVDIFVATVGTGGTLTGTGKYLKEKNPNIKIYAVEPKSSPLLSEGVAGPHKIQGIGANFVPEILDKDIYDKILTVSDEDAFKEMKNVAKTDGIFVGISSGAALSAAIEIAKCKENEGKNIVIIFPDTGNRYLSVL